MTYLVPECLILPWALWGCTIAFRVWLCWVQSDGDVWWDACLYPAGIRCSSCDWEWNGEDNPDYEGDTDATPDEG